MGQAGFTMIELLLVISVIALFASIILVSTVNARASAQDNILIQNTTEFSKALELYYQDYGYYPYVGMTDQTPCILAGFNVAGAHCMLGQTSFTQGYYSATNTNALSASLAPYMPQLPPQLTGAGSSPILISLYIIDPTYNAGGFFQDVQSNTCYQAKPNSYYIWALLNNRQLQAHLNNINSHGYIIATNMPIIPCP